MQYSLKVAWTTVGKDTEVMSESSKVDWEWIVGVVAGE
jgi:hypothetical protein